MTEKIIKFYKETNSLKFTHGRFKCDFTQGIFKFYPQYQWGDVNKDGIIDLNDVIEIYNSSSNFEYELSNDVNFDGVTDLQDLLFVYNLI